MLMALTEGEGPVTSSYIGSMCMLLPPPISNCSSLIFAFLFLKMITIVVMKTTTLVIKPTARELVAIMYAVFVHVSALFLSSDVVIFTRIGTLELPIRFPHSTGCIAHMHILWLVGMSVQVTVVWLVVVGQLPQFDARML